MLHGLNPNFISFPFPYTFFSFSKRTFRMFFSRSFCFRSPWRRSWNDNSPSGRVLMQRWESHWHAVFLLSMLKLFFITLPPPFCTSIDKVSGRRLIKLQLFPLQFLWSFLSLLLYGFSNGQRAKITLFLCLVTIPIFFYWQKMSTESLN